MYQSPARLRYDTVRAWPTKSLLRDKKFGYDDGSYTVTLGPGTVKYLDFAEFFAADVEAVISAIQAASATAAVEYLYQRMSHPDLGVAYDTKFVSEDLEPLLGKVTWPDKLRVHHALGRLMIDTKMPPWVYMDFHRLLELGQHFAIAECAEAWVPGTVEDWNLAKSYRASSEHTFVEHGPTKFAVFRKTSFVESRLDAVKIQKASRQEEAAREAEETHANALAEKLRRSRFTTFVYIMEDTRNGVFKIGHSRTPGKRERTLQSEVPEIILRFAVPAEEEHEKALHARFSHLRIRGEWFELSADEVVEAIAFLRTEGDPQRAEGDFHWLGLIFFRAGRSV